MGCCLQHLVPIQCMQGPQVLCFMHGRHSGSNGRTWHERSCCCEVGVLLHAAVLRGELSMLQLLMVRAGTMVVVLLLCGLPVAADSLSHRMLHSRSTRVCRGLCGASVEVLKCFALCEAAADNEGL